MSNNQLTTTNIFKVSGMVIILSVIINTIIYFLGVLIGPLDGLEIEGPDGSLMALNIGPVIGATIAFLVISTIGLVLINQFADIPLSTLRNLAIIAVLLSLVLPFTIPNVSLGVIIFLELMHLAAGLIAVTGLTTDILYRRFQ